MAEWWKTGKNLSLVVLNAVIGEVGKEKGSACESQAETLACYHQIERGELRIVDCDDWREQMMERWVKK